MVDLKKLLLPFDPSKVSWRVGSTNKEKTKGMALAYIDARDVMERLDEVCGMENWGCSYPHAGQKTICEISIMINGLWVSKADGAGDSDIEAEKGAISDGFKRAAVKWGVGRYLYDIDSPWVDIEPFGKSYKIKDSEKIKLQSILKGQKPLKIDPQSPNLSVPTSPRGERKSMPDEQYEEFRINIGNAPTMENLADLFGLYWSEAKKMGDNIAAEGFKKVYDIRKSELEREKENA